MLVTLEQARNVCSKFVGNGSCNTTVLDAGINEAVSRLMDQQPWNSLRRLVRISVCDHTFPLPHNVEKVLWADVNGSPAKVFGQAYQFLSSGPGDLDYRAESSTFKDIVDMGDIWPCMYDMVRSAEFNTAGGVATAGTSFVIAWNGATASTSTASSVATTVEYQNGLPLVAFSTEASDVGQEMTVEGYNSKAEEMFDANQDPGFKVTIQKWYGGVQGQIRGVLGGARVPVTDEAIFDITRVRKPVTKGYISLYAVDTTNRVIYFLAKYHPLETLPQFRRYRLTNHTRQDTTSVLAQVQLRHIPLVSAEDILPFDSVQAVKLMCMSIREEEASNISAALAFQQMAVAALAKREEANTLSDGTPVILNTEHRTSMGRRVNRRGIL